MKLTARNDQVTIKSQSEPEFASGKYGYSRKSASWEKSKVRALSDNPPLFSHNLAKSMKECLGNLISS